MSEQSADEIDPVTVPETITTWADENLVGICEYLEEVGVVEDARRVQELHFEIEVGEPVQVAHVREAEGDW